MKRDEIKSIVEGITDEQLQKILDINNSDIEKQKSKFQPEIDNLNTQLTEAKNTITTLEANKGNTEALQAELDKYKQAEADRKEAERKAAEHAAMVERFGKVKGEHTFLNDYTEAGILEQFKNAVNDKANTGKSDADIFKSLTEGQDVFKTGREPFKNPPVGKDWTPTPEVDAKMREAMGLPPTKMEGAK